MSQLTGTSLYQSFAAAFSYPGTDYHDRLAQLEDGLSGIESGAGSISQFRSAFEGKSVEECQEAFTRTFDLNPQCTPLVSIHLFGEESFKRGRLMSGLRDSFEAAGFDAPEELPDHLAVLLRYLPSAPEAERTEIARYLLRPPTQKMADVLNRADNPYAHLLRALQSALDAEFGKEKTHA